MRFYVRVILVLWAFVAWGSMQVQSADWEVMGARVTRDMDAPYVDTSWSGTNTGWHVQFYLRNISGASRNLVNFKLNDKWFNDIEDVSPGRASVDSSKWWIMWPMNSVPNGGISVLRLRLPNGPATIGGNLGDSAVLKLYTSNGTEEHTVAFNTTQLWIPFVHIADNRQDLTVYVGWRGSGSVTITPSTCLEINGATVAGTVPAGATTINTGEVVPLTVSLGSALTQGKNTVFHVSASGGEEAWGFMRAFASSFSTTLWMHDNNDDDVDRQNHFVKTLSEVPGSSKWQDEPYTFRPGEPAQNVADDAMGALAGSKASNPIMMQDTDTREMQVYCAMADISMTHDNGSRQQVELGLHHIWPRPTWYLPQIAWARTESPTDPLARETWYRIENFRRDALANLGRGSKAIQWFIHNNMWEQDNNQGGGVDFARVYPDLFFFGALGNPVVWDRIGRIAGLMEWGRDWLDDSAPMARNLMPNDIEALTLINPSANKATVIVTDYGATDLQDYYRTGNLHPDHTSLTTFTNLTVQATLPTWITADTAILLDPFDGPQGITMTGSGTVDLTLPYFQEAAVIVLGTSADLTALQSAWTSTYQPAFSNYGDPEDGNLAVSTDDMIPAEWLHRLGSGEKSMDMDVSSDGSRVLLVRHKTATLLDASGNTLWEQTYDGRAMVGCFSANGSLVYIGADIDPEATQGRAHEARLFCYNLSGTQQWVHDAGRGVFFDLQAPFSDNSVAYIMRDTWNDQAWYRRLNASNGSYAANVDYGSRGYFPIAFAPIPNGKAFVQGRMTSSNSCRLYSSTGSVSYYVTPESGTFQAACDISEDESRLAIAGTNLQIRNGANGSLLYTRYVGRNPRAIAISADGDYIAAGSCNGVVKVFSDTGTERWSDHIPGAYVSDIKMLPGDAGVAAAYEIFMCDQSQMWRFRDVTIAYNKDTGAELWRHEGRWRDQPFMTKIALSDTNNKLAVLAGHEIRMVDYTVSEVSNETIYDEPNTYFIPDPWINVDIGGPEYVGFADYSDLEDAFNIWGSGMGYGSGGRQEVTNFTYQPVSADLPCTITARIPFIRPSGSYGQAGLMIRDSLAKDAAQISLWNRPRQPNNMLCWYRDVANTDRLSHTDSRDESWEWYRLARNGDAIAVAFSQDGSSWTTLATETIPMTGTAYIGMGVMADTLLGGSLTLATYDNVVVDAGSVSSGTVTVNLSPAQAISEGAQWRLDGGAWQNSGNTLTEVLVGDYTIDYKDLAGWTTPTNDTITLTAGEDEVVAASYAKLSTGTLTVTIEPADAVNDGAQWQLNGGAWHNSGDTISGVYVGNHTVSYKTVSGWTPPAADTFTLSANENKNITATYTNMAPGSVTVYIDPPEAVAADARWRLDFSPRMISGDTITDVTIGNHYIEFFAIQGWTAPPTQHFTLSAGEAKVTTGIYTPNPGSIQITLSPAAAIAAGAEWRVNGGAWQNSGDTVADLTPFIAHTVEYKDIVGWTKPETENVTLSAGEDLAAGATYGGPLPGSVTVYIEPAEARTEGAQWQLDGGAWQNSGQTLMSVAAGQKTLTAKALSPPWAAPEPITITVESGRETSATLTYSPIPTQSENSWIAY